MKMRTDELIKVLTQSGVSKPRFGFSVAIFIVMLCSLLMTALVLGFRPEIIHVTPTWPLEQKILLLFGVTILSALELKNASTPLPQKRSLFWIGGFGILCVGLVICEWVVHPMREILNQFLMKNFPACLVAVTIYGTLGVIILTIFMRQYAPTNPSRTGLLIGLTAAAAGALGYSLHCPLDSPTFILIAYGIPVVFIAVLCRKLLPKFIVW